MSLTGGLTLVCGTGQAAGIKELYAIDIADLTSFTLASGSTSEYDTCTLVSAKFWRKFEFEQDQAEFRETVEGERGSYKVTHEVEIFVNGLAEAYRDAIQELIDNSPCGLILLVKDNTDVVHVMGYSADFLKTRPARIASVARTTLKALAEIPGSTIVLKSIDTDLANWCSAAIVIV